MVVPEDHIAAEPLMGAVAVTLAMPPEVLGALACEIRKKVARFVDANREVLLPALAGRDRHQGDDRRHKERRTPLTACPRYLVDRLREPPTILRFTRKISEYPKIHSETTPPPFSERPVGGSGPN
jgi:hypothetical protein